MRHCASLVFRGPEHAHPWVTTCVCGWEGVPRRRRREAERQYAAHRTSKEHPSARETERREPTAADELPQELRSC